ncbi:uroporphyrinogen-III synthase [Ornithinimicrobium cryptoxanthini]|uniref:uroporphyrinogen-III synthase n=1 Tax=Ornithinimicrobium cryptoxanthini TaxID=2934161 RepID=UPI0021179FB3|nr:bifunctional uroporphyrinogen-III C-methyltransferase/uroporphyrinogen-III synthase [Ornithinimicrobium cryptoxanthini]
MTPARVAFVGAGPGDPGLLTVRARDYLAAADVVVLDDPETAERLAGLFRADVQIVETGAFGGGQRRSPAARAKLLVRTTRALKQHDSLVVRVLAGDPAAFTTLTPEALACRDAGILFEVVPGVSTAWSVPTYAGVPLTSGGKGGAVHIIDAADAQTDWATSIAAEVTVVLLGTPDTLRRALGGLRRAGRDPQTPVSLTEHGTTVAQQTSVSVLEHTEALLQESTFGEGVVVVGQSVDLRHELSWFETKPLFGWNVLVPRTKDQAGAMTARIAMHGATSMVVPTISVEPPRTPQQMDRAIRGLVTGRYEWVGFTSVNAVRAVREKFTELGLDARAFAGLKVAAVGGVTADALRQWGIEPDLIPTTEQSAKGLLTDWPDYDDVLDPINRVLLPRADIATDTLVAGLIEMGWEVDDVTAYRTVRAAPPAAPVRDAIKGGAFDAVCFTSSSTVRNLVGIAGKPHPNTVVACIGPATARTAEEHGLRVDVVAPEPNAVVLVDALAERAAEMALAAQAAGEPVRPSQRRTTGRRGAARARA